METEEEGFYADFNYTDCDGDLPQEFPVLDILTSFVTGSLGLAGLIMNSIILVIIYQKKLISRDYRVLYYMFISIGDVMFSFHGIFVSFNTMFKSFIAFRLIGVCTMFMIVLGLVTYQWSAVCITLLLADLIWFIQHPCYQRTIGKRFCFIGCVSSIFIGTVSTIAPLLFWDDIPAVLDVCSVEGLYRHHWNFYTLQSTIGVAVAIGSMILVCAVLLYLIRKSQVMFECYYDNGDDVTGVAKTRSVVTEKASTSSTSIDVTDIQSKASTAVPDDDKRTKTVQKNKVNLPEAKNHDNKANNQTSDYSDIEAASRREIHRRQFMEAARTAGVFLTAYILCVAPYIFKHIRDASCNRNCDEDSFEAKTLNILVTTILHLLPVVDPILFIKRFQVIKQAHWRFAGICRCFTRKAYKTSNQNLEEYS